MSGHDNPSLFVCRWCGKKRRSVSDWEQQGLDGTWARLCSSCARSRLRNPYNALLHLRRIGTKNA